MAHIVEHNGKKYKAVKDTSEIGCIGCCFLIYDKCKLPCWKDKELSYCIRENKIWKEV